LIKKGSKSYSIFYNKCPKCHCGKFWHKNNPYLNIFKDNNLTNDHCDHCKFKYEIEPGFWFGAMYVSYGIAVVFLIIFGASLISLYQDIETLKIVSILSILVIILAPLNHFFFKTNLDKYFC
jgi:hypothetical protein